MFLLILLQYYYYYYLDNQLFNLLYTTVIVVSIFLLLFIRTKYRNLFVDFCYFSGISYLYSSNYTNNYQMVIVKNRFLNGSGKQWRSILRLTKNQIFNKNHLEHYYDHQSSIDNFKSFLYLSFYFPIKDTYCK